MTLTKRKILLWLCVLFSLLLVAIICVGFFVLKVPFFDQSGWNTTDTGAVQYLDYYGKPLTHWQTIDGKLYYFGSDGLQHIGWLDTDDGRIYLLKNGDMQTGWLELDGTRYYFDEAGKLQTGWHIQADNRIYLDADGSVYTGWLELPEGKFLLDQEGKPCTGWVEDNGLKYYFREDGTLNPCWKDTGDGLTYTVDGKAHTGWLNVPEDFENNLVSIGKYKIDATCRDALQKMLNDGNAAGYTTKILVSYRSKATQESLRASRKRKYIAQGMSEAQAIRKVEASVAIPGTSEHQTGLAVDITGTQKMYDWLEKNSWKYGFILRYPDDKIEITGIKYEPWHFRYVGKSLAKDIYESGLCLEEYLEALKEK